MRRSKLCKLQLSVRSLFFGAQWCFSRVETYLKFHDLSVSDLFACWKAVKTSNDKQLSFLEELPDLHRFVLRSQSMYMWLYSDVLNEFLRTSLFLHTKYDTHYISRIAPVAVETHSIWRYRPVASSVWAKLLTQLACSLQSLSPMAGDHESPTNNIHGMPRFFPRTAASIHFCITIRDW